MVLNIWTVDDDDDDAKLVLAGGCGHHGHQEEGVEGKGRDKAEDWQE